MNERPTQQSTDRWKWVAIILFFLLVLMVACLTSAVWGGLIGYAIGRSDGHMAMGYDGYYEPFDAPSPPYAPMPEMPGAPDMPFFEGRPWLGISFVMGPDGAQVTSVVPGSPADEEGLEVDDVITEVDGAAVTASRPLDELILGYEPGDRIELTVARDGRERTVRVRLATRMDGELPWHPDNLPMEPSLIPDWRG
ncbi:MAG: PDZ domain-containing protein [Anaerolineae bacterium]|nr:PDZ domain-containing protein [Anaerolineae bacterium]